MAKIGDYEKEKYSLKIKPYSAKTGEILREEQDAAEIINRNKPGSMLKRLQMADEMLNLASNYLVMSAISQSILNQKDEEALNDARKSLYKSIIYLEGAVSDFVDAPISDYEQQLAAIESFSPAQRYQLIKKAGLAIRMLEDAYGDNSKWKWSFVELEGRYAAVAKNIINLRNVVANSDPRSPNYEPTVLHLKLAKKLLAQAADRYRQKYELTNSRVDDFKKGIAFLSALRRINILTGAHEEAATIKKKLDIWNNKLLSDMNKQELSPKKK